MRDSMPYRSPLWLLLAATSLVVILVAYRSMTREKYGFDLDSEVRCAVFTPDSKYIVAGCHDRMFLLDVEKRKLVDRFPRDADAGKLGFGVSSFEVVAVSPDGKYVASAGAWKPIRVWDFETGQLVRSFDMDRAAVLSLAFSPDSRRLAAGAAYRVHEGRDLPYEAVYDVWLWDVDQEGDKPLTFHGHESPVQAIAFLPDGEKIVSVSSVNVLRLWDVATQRELRRSRTWMAPAGLGPVASGSTFGPQDSEAKWLLAHGRKGDWLAVSADGRHVVCGRSVWNAQDLTLEYFADGRGVWTDFDEWEHSNLRQPVPATDKQSSIFYYFGSAYLGTLTPDSQHLVVAGLFGLHGKVHGRGNLTPKGEELLAMKTPRGSGSLLSIFDVRTGQLLFEDQVFINGASVFALDVSPDGRYALAAGSGAGPGPGGAPQKRDPCRLYVYRLPRR